MTTTLQNSGQHLGQDQLCPSQVLAGDFPLCTLCSTQEIPQEHRAWQSTHGISSDLHNCLITPQSSTIPFSPTLSLTVTEETLFPSQFHRRTNLFWKSLESQVEKKPKRMKITLNVGESPFFGTRSCISSPSCVNHLLLPALHTRDSTQLISGWVFSESPILLAVEIGNKSKILISAS